MVLFSRWAVMHLPFGHRYSPVCTTRRCLCRYPLSSQPVGRSQVPIRNPLLLLQLYNHLTSAFILSLHLIFFFYSYLPVKVFPAAPRQLPPGRRWERPPRASLSKLCQNFVFFFAKQLHRFPFSPQMMLITSGGCSFCPGPAS